MAAPSLQTFGTLVGNAAAAVQGAAAALLDLTVGSALRAILEASASVALWLQFLLLQAIMLTRLATSIGADVDSWVADFGVTRLPGTAATGTVVLTSYSPDSSAATIPNGATVRTLTGIIYAVIGGPYIRAQGTATVTVQVACATAGSGGNAAAGAINLLGTAIPNIDTCSNPLAFTNGLDPEKDAALRVRFVTFINSRSQATQLAIENAIAGVQTGLLYQVVPNVDPSGAVRPGYFTCYVDDGTGDPPAALLAAVYAAVDLVRPFATGFAVLPPRVVQAVVTQSISAASGYTAAIVAGAVEVAQTGYLDLLNIGATASYSRLVNLAYSTAGVANVTGLVLNGGTADIAAAQGVAVRAQSVTATPT